MSRLGFVGRLMLIVTASLVALQLVILLAAAPQPDAPAEQALPRRPLADQVAALAGLAEQGAAVWALVRPLLADQQLRAEIAAAPPWTPRAEDAPRSGPLWRLFDGRIAAVLGGPREMQLWVGEAGDGPLGWIVRIGANPVLLRLQVRLADGTWLAVETRARLTMRLFGLPLGFIAGALGFAVAALALGAVWREARPLRELSRAAERFGRELQPVPVADRGAPDLRRLAAAFNGMQARIAALLRNRALVLGGLSHDLRTFVARLRLRLEALEPGETRRLALADLAMVQALLEDSLALARVSLAPGDQAVHDLVALAGEECASAGAGGAPLSFVSEAAEEVPVRGDAAALRRVVLNLVENALRYGGAAAVTVGIDAAGTEAVLAVEDPGPGIPPDQREAVFEPFHRLDASRNRGLGGAGLGLAIARQVAEAHGGSIRLGARADGTGTRAELRLRLARPA